jgi:hypothetical protein
MKKVFKLNHPKIKYARLIDNVRRDIKKYIKRERFKELPEGFDQWDFDCKFGPTPEAAEAIQLADIGQCITSAETDQLESFYIEILAKPTHRTDGLYSASTDNN